MDPAPPPDRPDPQRHAGPARRGRLALAVPGAGTLAERDDAAGTDFAGASFPCPVCGTRVEPTREHCFGCGWTVEAPDPADALRALGRSARTIYLLMALSLFTAVPAVAALALAYMDREKARGSWLDSHFEWQVETLWGVFWAGAAVLGATWLGARYLGTGEWMLLLGLPALAWYVHRIVKGWTRLGDGDPVTEY
jgi:uncharacterized membrane protein